ncbi:hypothetical protein [Intestinibacillus massiliensis]
MPNRILKESICTSDNLDGLNWFDEVFFYRLLVNCDDYGRMDARPAILRARLFPLKTVTDRQVESALQSLRTAGIVCLYEVDGKPFLQLRTWEKHQTVRAKKSKYPPPEAGEVSASESTCKQMQADASKCPRNPIQSESYSESESNPNISTEPQGDSMPVFVLPLNDGSQFPILENQLAEWETLYPAVDIMQDLRSMKGWLDANPTKRKTKRGILRFITGWLSRTQDKGGNRAAARPKGTGNVFADLALEMEGDEF